MTFRSKQRRRTTAAHDVFEKYYERPAKECTWEERTLRLRRVQHALMYMVEFSIRYGAFDWDVAGKIYSPSNPTPGANLKRLMKSRTVSAAHDELMRARMKELGLDLNFVGGILKDALEIAREKADPNAMVRVAQEINKMSGNYAAQVSVTENNNGEQSLPGEIMAEYERLKAEDKQTLSLPESTNEHQY